MDGLGEHFKILREDLNPDLNDIWASYIADGHVFLVAELDGSIAGCGALVRETPSQGRVVRVSVRRTARGKGVGQAIVQRLIDDARHRRLNRLVVETNNDWLPAISLYRRCGFLEIGRDTQSVYLAIDL